MTVTLPFDSVTESLPMRGAWIEIEGQRIGAIHRMVAPHAGAWIEMMMNTYRLTDLSVAPHAGSVD